MDLPAWLPLRWVVLLHVLSAFAFLALHAPSAAAMWRLRTERDPKAIAALLELSRATVTPMVGALLVLLVTGAILASVENAWRQPWAWGSALVVVALAAAMEFLATRPFNLARVALGLPATRGRVPAGEGLEPALARIRAAAPWMMASGLAGAALLVGLMAWRPA